MPPIHWCITINSARVCVGVRARVCVGVGFLADRLSCNHHRRMNEPLHTDSAKFSLNLVSVALQQARTHARTDHLRLQITIYRNLNTSLLPTAHSRKNKPLCTGAKNTKTELRRWTDSVTWYYWVGIRTEFILSDIFIFWCEIIKYRARGTGNGNRWARGMVVRLRKASLDDGKAERIN